MAKDLTLVLADNVSRLMRERGDTQTSVAERGRISQRSVGYVVTYGKTHNTAPTLRTVEGLARAFSVPAWLLFVPDVPMELLKDHQLDRLVSNFSQLPSDARANVTRVAEGEVRYAASAAGAEETGT